MLRKGGGQLNTVQNNPSPFSVVDGGNKKINDSLVSKYDKISVDEARKIYEHAVLRFQLKGCAGLIASAVTG